MSEEPTEKPKLIIDDDWKERVQSEKEAAAAAAKSARKADSEDAATDDQATGDQATGGDKTPDDKTPGADATGTANHDDVDQDAARPKYDLPPASFATLVHSLTAQTLSCLGQIPDAEGNVKVEIEMGKHFIDTLAVLEEKTKGNLDQDESAALTKMLYELRMLFVHVRKEQQAAPAQAPKSADEAG